jgi:DNA-binding MurR/RpiR family transcriptional regulator
MPPHQPPSTLEALNALVRERFAGMSSEFQRAARLLADHPEEIAFSSMRSLAARAGIQPPTLVRFAQSLGFSGWPAMRELFVAGLRTRSVPYASKARALVQRGSASDLIAEIGNAQKLDIESTRMQSAEALPRVAALLRKARTIHVAGFRSSYAIAFGFAYLYRLFRQSVSLLGTEGGTLEMQLRAIESGDATVVVSFAPYSREARLVAEAASRARSKVIAITDSAVAPIALQAHETVLFSVTSPSFFPSLVGGISVAESLLGVIVSQEGKDVVKRIEASERQLFESGAYEEGMQASAPKRKRRK